MGIRKAMDLHGGMNMAEYCPYCNDRLTRFNDPKDVGACVRCSDYYNKDYAGYLETLHGWG